MENWLRQYNPVRAWSVALRDVHVRHVQGRGEERVAIPLVGTAVTPAPVFGEKKKHWSMGSIVRGHWWAITSAGAEEVSIVGTVSRLHSVNGKWRVTLHYDDEDVGPGVPTEFDPSQISWVERSCPVADILKNIDAPPVP